MILKVFKLEEDSPEPLLCLENGSHSLGRGNALQCTDKRVSRNHVEFNVDTENTTITVKHEVNPCFYRINGSKHISILKYNEPNNVTDGDCFGFFPDSHWFKLKLAQKEHNVITASAESNNNQESIDNEGHKQENNITVVNNGVNENSDTTVVNNGVNENNDTTAVNKGVVEHNDTTTEVNNGIVEHKDTTTDTSNAHDDTLETVTSTNDDVKVKEEKISDDEENEKCPVNTTTECPIKEEPLSNGVEDNQNQDVKTEVPSDDEDCKKTTQTKQIRDRCWYGSGCYRKNLEHKARFSHPGDADYDTDPNDDRPCCSYGRQCYRKNGDHRRNFKHTSATKPPKRKISPSNNSDDDDPGAVSSVNIVITKRKKKVKKEPTKFDDDEEDDYDFNDPFIDDGTEDEYELESEDSDF